MVSVNFPAQRVNLVVGVEHIVRVDCYLVEDMLYSFSGCCHLEPHECRVLKQVDWLVHFGAFATGKGSKENEKD